MITCSSGEKKAIEHLMSASVPLPVPLYLLQVCRWQSSVFFSGKVNSYDVPLGSSTDYNPNKQCVILFSSRGVEKSLSDALWTDWLL